MSQAKLLAIEIERFKSFDKHTRIELAPLTVILGRNNSGKSSLIQALLLLKQTLADVRPNVTLKLEGMVEAFNLRELTFGWPKAAHAVPGPTITVEWESRVDVANTLASLGNPELKNLAKLSGVDWLESPPETKRLTTSLTLRLHEVTGTPSIASLVLRSVADNVTFEIDPSWNCLWNGVHADKLEFGFDHFIPYVKFPNESGPRARQRVWHNAFNVVFGHPLEALHQLLGAMQYLSSTRQLPPSLYRPATTAPDELGVSGELAAQWLHRQQKDVVHFLPPPRIEDDKLVREDRVLERPLVQAVNTLFEALSVRVNVRVEEVQEVGFRLMFGDSSLVHVGRGIGYLLPLVELGLFADPLRFESTGDMPLTQYTQLCQSFTHIALEEPEAHLHPKVASRLAHWLVSLAMSNRRLIVETHSDHLVRRLRGLVARAGQGSELEKWLLENVVVLSVEQDAEGRSSVTSSRLTADGSVGEVWPADFMDEATDEESAIYYAKLDKAETREAPRVELIDGEEPELNEAP